MAKKLLEESTIRRFMKLANIDAQGTGLLSENKAGKSPVTKGGGHVDKHHKKFTAGTGKHLAKKSVHESQEEEEENLKREAYEEEEESLEEASYEEEEESLEEASYEEQEESLEEAEGEEEEEEEETDEDPMGDESVPGDEEPTGETSNDELVSALEELMNDLVEKGNRVLQIAGSDSELSTEPTGGEESGMEMPEEEPAGMGEPMGMAAPMAERKKTRAAFKKQEPEPKEESLEESVDVLDNDLIETLLKRVTTRLMKEAKAKKLAESKSGGMKKHPKGYTPHGGHHMSAGQQKVAGGEKSGLKSKKAGPHIAKVHKHKSGK